jgi:hypothetical protein
MRKYRFTIAVMTLVLGIVVVACVKDEIDLDNYSKDIYWAPKIEGPVAHGNFTINNLIESLDDNSNFSEDSSKFMTLVYTNRVLSESAEKLLKIPDQDFNEVMLASAYSIPASPSQNPIILKQSKKYTFALDKGELVDSLTFKAATLVFQISSSYKYLGNLKITIPKLRKNNVAFETIVDIDKADGTFAKIQSIDLKGYKLEIDHPAITDNLISFDYTATLVNPGTSGVNAGDNIDIDINLKDILFSSMYGYIGQMQLMSKKSHIELPLFNHISDPHLQFKNPQIGIRTINSFGVPIQMELYNVEAYSQASGITKQIAISSAINPFLLSTPEFLGGSKNDTITFNKTTTNFDQALNIGPSMINYSLSSVSNPAGKANNFVTDSSKLDVFLDLELPLELKTSLLEFVDTMDMDLSDLTKNTDKIKSATIHSSFENGMPFDLSMQAILTDLNYNSVDTLFTDSDQPVISSGPINSAGKVSSTTKKDIDVFFDSSRTGKLKKVKYVIVKGSIITSNHGADFVKFYSDYLLKMNFGIKTELEIKENK